MKCIKNSKTEEIKRVDDSTAHNMVGNLWNFVPKSEWKLATRTPKSESTEKKIEKKKKTLGA
jgi:hypothetical protein